MSPPEPRPDPAPDRRQILSVLMMAAFGALVALALAEIFGLSTVEVRLALMSVVGVAGTVALIVHARQRCPDCDSPYGFTLRMYKTHRCRRCGAELPSSLD